MFCFEKMGCKLLRKKFGFLFLFLAIIASPANAFEAGSPPELKPLPQQVQAARLTAEFLSRFHYKPVPLDDALSVKIMNRYIDSLDPDRLIFLQSDIDSFKTSSKEIDDSINQEDLSIPFAIFNIYGQRVGGLQHFPDVPWTGRARRGPRACRWSGATTDQRQNT